MNQAEVTCTLLIVVAALAILAKKVALPYPVLLVIGGLALGFVPGLPAVQLEPEMVFLFLLPPLLYPAALFTSWRDFRANLSPILLLAIGLILLTTAFVAVVAHALSGLPWAAAFVLGAIISPTDAVAATAITSRLRVPRRIVTVLDGESLVNDATALVAYRFAIVAMMSGTFSLSAVLHTLSGHSLKQLVWHGALISCAAIVVRIVWVFTSTNLLRLISAVLHKKDPYPAWQNAAIVAWTGMRGVVSLAAALAVPLTLSDGSHFPGRDYILFITFCVILATLVLQGLSLPALIRRLGVVDDGLANVEERTARLKANEAALAYLSEVDSHPQEFVERLRAEYNDRIRQLEVCASVAGDRSDGLTAPSYQRLQQDALDVERRTIIQLRDEYVIDDEVLRRIQLDLDHAEASLHVRE